ncbi:MAG: Gfo/Idh/MocA family oxidoreductase [Chloroflexota bacterium]|nr:Gfo/Idh/MocA family oxidoreductase [Chloroflexota bacterium]MDE2897269.1 Gfo/Idh/MocA family oxidoreductase [Chloroflexota bacterium]
MTRAAVIGLGRIASTWDEERSKYDGWHLPHAHIGCMAAVPEIEIVGLSDTWSEQREAARAKWGIDALYADYREMLAKTRPQIVSICTSMKPRTEILLEIANGDYGVQAIWAEKPLTYSLAQADEVIAACRKAGIHLAVNCTHRWRDSFTQAREMIDDGLIGDVIHVQGGLNCNLSHNGSHLITRLTTFTDAPVAWVAGEAESDDAVAGDDDFAGNGYFVCQNGVRGMFRGMRTGGLELSYDITGTDGMIRLMDDSRSPELWRIEEGMPGQRGPTPVCHFFRPSHNPRAAGVNVLYDLMNCIETGDDSRCSGEDAREALEIAIAVRESHRRGGGRVDLPLEDRSLGIVSREVLVSELPRAILRRREAEAASQAGGAS